jgi:hypothetical protein
MTTATATKSNTVTADQQIAFEALVSATAAAHGWTRPQAIEFLISVGSEPSTMF